MRLPPARAHCAPCPGWLPLLALAARGGAAELAPSSYSVPLGAGGADECGLLCEADERCVAHRLELESGACVVEGGAGAEGSPAPEGATAATYARPGGAGRNALPGREGDGARRVLLVTYAAGAAFEETQRRLDESLGVAEIQEHWRWTASSFAEGRHGEWFRAHRRANFRRGGAWKPYIIWQALRRVHWGDWLVYHDASQYVKEGFSSSVQPLLAWLSARRAENPCECIAAVRLRQTLQHEWEQQCVPPYGPVPRDPERAFDSFCGTLCRLGACAPSDVPGCCRGFWERPTLQHSWSVWRKNRRTARFLREWARQAADFEVVAHLPLIDQSLNALLVHRWHAQLGIRPLWVPSLYEASWNQLDTDLGTLGRIEGFIFKHINFVLDELHNERAAGRTLVWLADPYAEGRSSAEQLSLLSWSAASAPAAPWRRSLCAAPGDTPALSARVVAAQLFQALDGALVRWSGRYKAPAAWPSAVYAPLPPGELPRAWAAALALGPQETTGGFGARALADRGLSSSFSLGSWRLRARPAVGGGAPASERVVVAQLVLLNDGREPWPAGAALCGAPRGLGGNGSAPAAASLRCQHEEHFGAACGAVPAGGNAQLHLALPVSGLSAGGGGWREVSWALCAGSGPPFGALLQLRLRTD